MEWLEEFGVFIATYGEKILAWLGIIGGTTIGGISIWKIGVIIANLIKRAIEKKYTSKQKEYRDEVINAFENLQNALIDTVKAEVKEQIGTIKDTFNELEDKKTARKQKLYEQVFNEKQQIETIEQKVVKKNETEIDTVEPKQEQINEIVIETTYKPIQEQNETENKKKDIDLL